MRYLRRGHLEQCKLSGFCSPMISGSPFLASAIGGGGEPRNVETMTTGRPERRRRERERGELLWNFEMRLRFEGSVKCLLVRRGERAVWEWKQNDLRWIEPELDATRRDANRVDWTRYICVYVSLSNTCVLLCPGTFCYSLSTANHGGHSVKICQYFR